MITGPPRCGKTTLLIKIAQDPAFSARVGGFITQEIREKGERFGFKIVSVADKKESFLAMKGFSSPYRVGKYGVNLENVEKVGCTAIQEALDSGRVVLVDEIGKMELFSEKFKNVLVQALNSPQKVLATIIERPNEFADRIKKRKDTKLIHLSPENFDKILAEVLNWLRMGQDSYEEEK